jgi:hypothetical protein
MPKRPPSKTRPKLPPPKAPEPTTTEPSMAAVDPTTTEPSMLAVSPSTTEPSMPQVAPKEDPGATDESVARSPRGRQPPVRRERTLERRQQQQKKKGSPLVPLLLLVVLGLGGFAVWKKYLAPPPPARGPDPRVQEEKDAMVTFQDAKNLIRRGQWKQAKVELDDLYARLPELEGLKVYVDAAAAEVPVQEHLDNAEGAIQKGECGRAAGELKAVPESSKQYARRGELDTKLSKLVDEKVKEAQGLAATPGNKDKMRKLKALAEDLLAARPQNRDAQALLATAERALGAKAAVEAAPDPGDPAAGVIELYVGGNAAGAFSKADECAAQSARCSQLKQQITEVNDLTKKVESLDADQLEHIVKVDRAICGGRLSPLGKPAGVRLAALLYPKASSAAVRKQWGPAMQMARRILEGEPNHEGAKGIVADGRTAANELYQRCYVGRTTSPEDALPLCKEVIQMLPEGDDIRRKAERILSGGASE